MNENETIYCVECGERTVEFDGGCCEKCTWYAWLEKTESAVEEIAKSLGWTCEFESQASGGRSRYYDLWREPESEESDEEFEHLKLRISDHSQCYDADISIDQCGGASVDQFAAWLKKRAR
ncbi:MAG: hypothetical protein WC485_00030 [Opitutaceae bacterium]